MSRVEALLPSVVLLTLVGCGNPSESQRSGLVAGGESPGSRAVAETVSRQPDGVEIRVVVLGDSLAAGLGLEADEAFPAILEHRLRQQGLPVRILNAGVSGDTSAGGLSRLSWVLRQQPDLVVVELGANDGLRGLSPEMTEENLGAIIRQAREAGAHVLLLGMRLPPNYGDPYVKRFESVFPRLADELGVPLVPFFLEGVAGRPELNLADGIHPNAAGQRRVAENLHPHLEEILTELRESSAAP